LIKLIDATQYYPNYVPEVDQCETDCTLDQMLRKFPSSKLCDNSAGNSAEFGKDGHNIGYCSNLNSPGFFAVLFYDIVRYATNPFRLYTRAAQDYGTTTQFFVFTTKGYLNLVSPHSVAYTQTYTMDRNSSIASHYSRVVHLANTSTGSKLYPGYYGNIDCETNAIGQNGARDCLNKNDWVMLFGTGEYGRSTIESLNANPVYPNMFQVSKIYRKEKTWVGDPSNPNSEMIRHRMVLSFSNNAEFFWHGGNSSAVDTSAQVYKFHPDTSNSDGGYRYVAQCSNRGICNTETGTCECFHGYTSDDCGTINALAQ